MPTRLSRGPMGSREIWQQQNSIWLPPGNAPPVSAARTSESYWSPICDNWRKTGSDALSLAAFADHFEARDRHVTVLGGVLIDSMLAGFVFDVFLGSVQCGVGHYSGNRDRVPDVRREFDAIALQFPGAAVGPGEIEFLGIVRLGQAAFYRPHFLVSGFFLVLCVRNSNAGHQNKSCECYVQFDFH